MRSLNGEISNALGSSELDSMIFGLMNLNQSASSSVNKALEEYKQYYETLSEPVLDLVFSVMGFGASISSRVRNLIIFVTVKTGHFHEICSSENSDEIKIEDLTITLVVPLC